MSTPSSISRDKSYTLWAYYEDPTQCSSILGKRKQGSGEDATIQPDAKRPATQSPPSAEGRDYTEKDEDNYVNTPSSGLSSSASDVDEPEGLESDSKPKSARGTFYALPYISLRSWDSGPARSQHGCIHHLQLTLLTSLKLQGPFRPRRLLVRSKSRQPTITLLRF